MFQLRIKHYFAHYDDHNACPKVCIIMVRWEKNVFTPKTDAVIYLNKL
jgi:hypothetical protein